MQFPTKQVLVDGRPTVLQGVSNEDPYFASIGNNFDPSFIELCRRFLREDYNCLDIGANIGVKALAMAHLAVNGRTVAVEPAPTVLKCLTANISANHILNVELAATAISDREGTVHFIDASAYGHIDEGGIEVPVTTLPQFVERLGLPRVDFIKIDVEGFEYPILRTSLDLINQHKSLVLFEMNSWCQIANTDTSPKEFVKWILGNFAHVYALNPTGTGDELLIPYGREEWRRLLHRNIVEDRCVTDILATNFSERLVENESAMAGAARANGHLHRLRKFAKKLGR